MRKVYRIAHDGSPNGDGTRDNPFSLQYALDGADGRVGPGSTLLLEDGIYYGNFSCDLKGTKRLPIRIFSRRWLGARLVNKPAKEPEDSRSTLQLERHSEYIIVRGLEVTADNRRRVYNVDRPTEEALVGSGIHNTGKFNQVLNCWIHDNGSNGLLFAGNQSGGLIYGNILFNNGVMGTSRGHGHNIYCQNQGVDGIPLKVFNNIGLPSFGFNLQFYGSSRAVLDGFLCQDNFFAGDVVLVGGLGGPLLGEISLRRNIFFGSAGARLGYEHFPNENVEFAWNILWSEWPGNWRERGQKNYASPLVITQHKAAKVYYNRIYKEGQFGTMDIYLRQSQGGNMDLDSRRNMFYADSHPNNEFQVREEETGNKIGTGDFQDYQSRFTSAGDRFMPSTRLPRTPMVKLIKNKYDSNLIHVHIVNWPQRREISVNPRRYMCPNERYKLVDAQNPKVVLKEGIFNGDDAITINMNTDWNRYPVQMDDDFNLAWDGKSINPKTGAYILIRG